jgi:hypothetical protein
MTEHLHHDLQAAVDRGTTPLEVARAFQATIDAPVRDRGRAIKQLRRAGPGKPHGHGEPRT